MVELKNLTKEELIDIVEKAFSSEKSDKKKKELSELLSDLKDGSISVAKATTVLSLRGFEWTWSKTKPFISGVLDFVSSAWNTAKEKNAKNDDK